MANFKTTTIKQVAEKANVSIATVSRVINNTGPVKESTRMRILSAIDELEYSTHAKKGRPPKTILVSFPDLVNPFNSGVIRGICSAASQYGYKVIFHVLENYYAPASYGFFTTSQFFDGLLLVHNVPDKNILAELVEKIPIVMCSEHVSGNAVSYVAIDDFAAAQMAVDYLIRIGRKKIALINSSLSNNYAFHRERGYRASLEAAGLSINEKWIINLPAVNFTLAFAAVSDVLKHEELPDAFFCVSDVYAAAAINAAKAHGLSVPENLSVIGFDDIDLTTIVVPSITTIHQPAFQMGYQSCSLLIDQIEYPSSKTRQIVLNTDLIVRTST